MSALKVDSEESLHALPPIFILNTREKIQPDQVPVEELVVLDKKHQLHHEATLMGPYLVKPPPEPKPKFVLEMTWNPSSVYFELDEEPVTLRVRIWNSSYRSMYFLYCGLWEDRARLCASWHCSPRTRIWLPPGFSADITVKATPREVAPIPCANASLQIAAGHLRDIVAGYFSIPITAKFLKYVPPPPPEGEYNE